MHCFVYILQSKTNGQLYIGQTKDLSDRINRHQKGFVRATKGRGPWIVIHSVKLPSRSEAVKLERMLKRFKSRERILRWIEQTTNSHPE